VTLRFFIDVLSGTPSIVLGIFGLLFLVVYLKPFTGGFSLLSGGIALAILILPVIERSIEEAIYTVPAFLEEGSYALGATQWDTIKRIVIPFAMSGIITGIILGIGRAAEESAVVMLTAGYTQFMPQVGIRANSKLLFGVQVMPFQDLVAILPVSVYHSYEFGKLMPISNGFAAALVLIVIVMAINAVARLVLWRWKSR
jgi:phosphate transport system permease protein